jgi:PST family polysaccharide transporter
MSIREQAVRGIGWSAVRNWGGRAINVVVFLVLAWLLPPAAIGLVGLAGVYVSLVKVFVDQGFVDALVQREELRPAHLDTAFWTNMALGGGFVGLSVWLAEPVAQFFAWASQRAPVGPAADYTAGGASLDGLIRALSPAFLLAALVGVQEALFERDLDYRLLAIRKLVAMATGGAVGIGMALRGWGAWSLVGYQLTERAVAAVVLWAASDWRPRLRWHVARFRELFAFGVNVAGANLMGFFKRRSDTVIVALLGPRALGLYVVARRILRVTNELLMQTVSTVVFSAFSRLQGEPERARRGFYSTTRMVSLVAVPLFIGGAVLAPQLFGTLFNQSYAGAAPIFRVLALLGLLQAGFYFNGAVMSAMGRPDWQLGINGLNAAANVGAMLLALPYGVVGVAAAYTLRAYLLAPVSFLAVRHLIGVAWRDYLGIYRTPLLAAAVMAAGVWALRALLLEQAIPSVGLLVGVPAGAALYTLAVWVIEPERLARLQGLAKEFAW